MPSDKGIYPPGEHYRNGFARRSKEELKTLTHLKRTMECFAGDPKFRQEILKKKNNYEPLLRERGIEGIDPRQLFYYPEKGVTPNAQDLALEKYPLAKMWAEYVTEAGKYRDLLREQGNTAERNPRFHAWRQRQIARCISELGSLCAEQMVHSILTFELSKGCSIGCSFCAFAAEKLQGVFAHTPENASLWREILETALDLFGPAVLTAICYWATEPSDNPDYLRFLKDFCDLTGIVPQTTTAAPLKNLDWTRELLQLRKENPSTPDRFSILSTVMLGRVHEAFSAEELLCVELVQQQPSAMIPKARSGRARLSKRWLPKAPPALNESRSGPAAQPCEGPNPSQGCSSGQSDAPRAAVIRSSRTISCLSGYLVSMMDRTIQLVSPCAATDRWPLGYRVHAQGRFANASDFRKFIERSIAECMDDHLGGDEPLAFRRDLTYAPLPGGFSLTNDYFAHKVTDAPLMARLGEMVGKGNMTAGEVMDALLREGGDLLEVTGAIKGLFDKGLLDDEKPTKEWLA